MHFAFSFLFYRRARQAGSALAAGVLLAGCATTPLPVVSLPGDGVNVYAAGDIAQCHYRKPSDAAAAGTAALVAAQLARDRQAVVLTLGDHTYPVGLPAEFTDCYGPTWGRFKERTHPVPGNHEYYTRGAPGYYGYFGAAAGPAGRGYYSMQIGRWHVIALNSNLRNAQFAEQLEWLKADLDRNRKFCTLAYFHHPVFSSGGHGSNDYMLPVWKILAAANAELVLASHDHDYERFAPQDGAGRRDSATGIRHFVIGTGGAQLTPLRLAKANSEVRDNSAHGVLKLVLKDTGYEWEFLPATQGGFTDRGTALCH
ncbi:MAG: alkaline phosphatase [Herminiimonas sp.]|nr:alkaline phosphatase [Herminiimonas sp.]